MMQVSFKNWLIFYYFSFIRIQLADTLGDLDPVYVYFIKYFTVIANSSIRKISYKILIFIHFIYLNNISGG